jgi:hypothetical protein
MSSSKNIFRKNTYAKFDGNSSFNNGNYLNKSSFKNKSLLNRSDLESNASEKAEKVNSDNAYFSRSFSSKKNIIVNAGVNNNKNFFEKVIEEPNNFIDEKLRKIISNHKMSDNVRNMSKRGSLLSLLKFAVGSNVVFLNTGNFKNPNHKYENQNLSHSKNESFSTGSFDICLEYMRYLN